jgi:hypothetical protein
MREIDRTVAQHVRTPLGPEFMAPPETGGGVSMSPQREVETIEC